ncbi:transposase [Streptosporangium canum]|uniref:transposase n=1 Tax=Streptosporangium canum TaxID=324952 RepID=UPI0036C284ED
MTRRRGQFSSEFKEEAVRMVLEGERTVASVARESGSPPHLGSWVNRRRIVHGEAERPVSGPERARVRELERENAELREKPASLKKRPPPPACSSRMPASTPTAVRTTPQRSSAAS